MHHYDKVLYLDCDMVAERDIGDLFASQFGNAQLCAVRDTNVACWYNIPGHDQKIYMDESLCFENPYAYFNAGVLLMNVQGITAMYTAQDLLELVVKKRWKWLDQDMLNVVFCGRVQFLEQSWNVMVHNESNPLGSPETYAPHWLAEAYKEARKHPWIIHYAGHMSPCFVQESDMAEYFWKYARNTPFYEMLLAMPIVSTDKKNLAELRRSVDENLAKLSRAIAEVSLRASIKQKFKRHIVLPIIGVFLPIGSLRRAKIKKAYLKLRNRSV